MEAAWLKVSLDRRLLALTLVDEDEHEHMVGEPEDRSDRNRRKAGLQLRD